VASASLVLDAFSSTGAVADSILAHRALVERLISADVPAALQSGVRSALLTRAMAFALPVLGFRAVGQTDTVADRSLAMATQLAGGDQTGVRRRLAVIDSVRGTARPGTASIDAVYLESYLYVQCGDSSGANGHLDKSLNHLVNLPRTLFELQWNPGALVRSMALRAQLATAQGDSRVARHWARAVSTLWANADPSLSQTTAAIRGILSKAS
jgi:hypothetical protein